MLPPHHIEAMDLAPSPDGRCRPMGVWPHRFDTAQEKPRLYQGRVGDEDIRVAEFPAWDDSYDAARGLEKRFHN